MHLGTIVHDVFGKTEGDVPDGGSPLTGVVVRNDTGEKEVPLRGLFYAIGHRPNTGLFGVSVSVRHRLSMTMSEVCMFCKVTRSLSWVSGTNWGGSGFLVGVFWWLYEGAFKGFSL